MRALHTLFSQSRIAVTALALLLILFLALNILSANLLTSTRLDLTEEGLYSLSDATETLIENIEEPVTLKFYYSQSLGRNVPFYGIYAGRVRDLLGEYEARSGGKIRVEIYDPQPFTELEDRAVADGLQQIPLQEGGENVFFGIAGTNLTDDQEVIPFLQPERETFLEYDISRLIHALATPKRTVVGIVTSLPMDGTVRMNAMGQQTPVPPYVIADQIGATYETRYLDADLEKVPEDVTVLMLAHPGELGEKAQFAIDQFLLGGGKALIFVDPYSESEGGQAQFFGRSAPDSSDLPILFEHWGVDYDPTKVAADRLTARKVQPGQGRRLVDYVAWLELRGGNIDKSSPITTNVDTIAVASAGHIALAENARVRMTPLVSTSLGSMELDAEQVKGMRTPETLLKNYQPGASSFVVAARLTADALTTAFPDGPPTPKSAEGEEAPSEETGAAYKAQFPTVLSEAAVPLDVIVVADSDVLADRFWVQVQQFFGRRVPVPVSGNGDFVLNALDALSGSSSLLGLRGRGSTARPFEVLDRIEREAEKEYAAQEERLQKTLAETEQRFEQLRRGMPEGAAAIVSDSERAEIERYRQEILRIRSELRAVQRSVREDVDRLESELWFYNIALVPLLVTVLALLLALWRTMRRRRRLHAAAG
ncbi:GldG family protein [Nisaea acidiphila]|uniref:GldG family protein n=1 Tax=Nisaea acidiphila TaxID=1862145 RepID=A0A9J7ANH0_9PROT|nr:GldG family protein [Nisaea acidiphila]UUX48137.1 GldG family protein [Nisaea acidiphila]